MSSSYRSCWFRHSLIVLCVFLTKYLFCEWIVSWLLRRCQCQCKWLPGSWKDSSPKWPICRAGRKTPFTQSRVYSDVHSTMHRLCLVSMSTQLNDSTLRNSNTFRRRKCKWSLIYSCLDDYFVVFHAHYIKMSPGCVWHVADKDEYYCLPYQTATGGALYSGDQYHDLERVINNVDCLPSSASSLHLRCISSDTLNG